MTNALQAFLSQNKDLQQAQRRRSLYSDFSSHKILNPTTYERNVKIWKQIIFSSLEKGILLPENEAPWLLNISDLVDKLSWFDPHTQTSTQPLSIDTVIKELMIQNELCTAHHYLQGKTRLLTQTSYYWSALSKVIFRLVGEEPSLPDFEQNTNMVIKKPLQRCTKEILQYFQQNCVYYCTDRLMNLSEFKEKLLDIILNQLDIPFSKVDIENMNHESLMVLLIGLKEKGVMIEESKNHELGLVLKFPPPNKIMQYINSDQPIPNHPLNELDYRILTLKKTHSSLFLQIQDIENKIEGLKKQCKEYHNTGLITQATFSLKRLHLLRDILEKRLRAHHSVNAIITQIQGAETDHQVQMAYQAGTIALKAILTEYKLDNDSVDTTMDNLKDILTDFDEVQQAVSKPIYTSIEEDEELEAELEELMKEESPGSNQVKHQISLSNNEDRQTQTLIKELSTLSIVNDPLPEVKEDEIRPVKRAKSSPTREYELAS